MLEYVPLSIALAGSSLAGAWDLKTTEIPDIIPHVMIVLGLVFWGFQSYILHDYWLVIQSALVGSAFLGFGFLMYYFGQWGGGDAKIFSAIGFLVPTAIYNSVSSILPFPLTYLINVFLLGAVYMIFYAFVVAVRNRNIIQDFSNSVKANSKMTLLILSGIFISFFILMQLIGFGRTSLQYSALNALFIASLYLSLVLLWRFVLSVEKIGFRKKIPVSKLKIGDVLLESKYWEGITKDDIHKMKKSGKRYVVIKDGVRFGPVFPMALVFTLIAGNVIALLFNFSFI